MVLPPLEQLPVGMPASLTDAFQDAEKWRDHQAYLLVAHILLKKHLAAPPPQDPRAAYKELSPLVAVAVPPPGPEDVRRYEQETLKYNTRRDHLATNLAWVEGELFGTLTDAYRDMLRDMLRSE
jgi:hypothetical protein